MSHPLVSLARCATYAPAEVEASLAAVLAPLGGLEGLVAPGSRVLVKPNLLKRARPEDAVTTHPEIVRAVVRALKAAGAGDIAVGDSPGGRNTAGVYRRICEASGIAQVCAEEDVRLVLLDDAVARAEVPDGRLYQSLELAAEAVGADALVNLPKLKTHGFMLMTAAVKNLFGLVAGLEKARFHLTVPGRAEFAEMLVDITLACPPTLTVLDAVVAMEGQGPGGGDPMPLGVVAASADPFALDVVAEALCGFRPGEVYTVAAARGRGLGPASADEAGVAGVPWRELAAPAFAKPSRDFSAFLPRWIVPALRDLTTPRPRLAHPEVCTGCGTCRRDCPVGAIEMAEGRPRFDMSACIRCYCCQELCPPQALEVRAPWLLRIVARRERRRA